MTIFNSFESRAIRLLTASELSPGSVGTLIRESVLATLETSEQGYELTARHPSLIQQTMICDTPIVLGRYENTEVRFTASIAAGEIRLSCRSTNELPVPEYFRERDVVIEQA